MGIGLAAQDGLDSLGDDCPRVLKILVKLLFVENELAQSLQRALNGNHAMAERHTDIAEHGGIGQVALQAADGQFLCQELQDGIGDAEITLRILIVDRIDLMRHGTGTHLAGLDFLLEILHGDIHPEIAVEVDDNGIDTTDGIEDGTHLVVVANLRGVLLTLQPQLLADEAVAEGLPIDCRIGHAMGIEITGGTAELGRHGNLFQRFQLLLQTIHEDHDFLAQACGGSRLSVSLSEHRHILPLFRIVGELLNQLFHLRNEHIGQRLFHGKGHAGVVNVLGGESEMDEFLILGNG